MAAIPLSREVHLVELADFYNRPQLALILGEVMCQVAVQIEFPQTALKMDRSISRSHPRSDQPWLRTRARKISGSFCRHAKEMTDLLLATPHSSQFSLSVKFSTPVAPLHQPGSTADECHGNSKMTRWKSISSPLRDGFLDKANLPLMLSHKIFYATSGYKHDFRNRISHQSVALF